MLLFWCFFIGLLNSSLVLADPYILYDKGTYNFLVKEQERVLFSTLAGYGLEGPIPKERKNDFFTPEGLYYIKEVRPSKSYLYFAELDYPNLNDLSWAYFYGVIDWEILRGYLEKKEYLSEIKAILGSEVGIHGGGSFKIEKKQKNYNWTKGCLALDNEDLREVLPYFKPRTKVYLLNSQRSLFDLVKKFAFPRKVKPLAFWEGGLYLKTNEYTLFYFYLREEKNGRKYILVEKWIRGRLDKKLESEKNGRFAPPLEEELKKIFISSLSSLEDPFPERVVQEWK